MDTKLNRERIQDSHILFSVVADFLEGQDPRGELQVLAPEGKLVPGATCESLPSHQVTMGFIKQMEMITDGWLRA